MTLDMKGLLPPGSHSWCGDCDWTNLGQDCHRHGKTHSTLMGHVVHVWEQEPVPEGWTPGTWACGNAHVSALLGPMSCTRPRDHDGEHAVGPTRWSSA